MELPVHLIERARRGFVADRRAHRFAPDYPLQAQVAHQPLNGASRDGEALAVHLSPDLAHPVNAEVLGNHSHWDCTLEKTDGRYLAVRLGFRQVRGLANLHGAAIVGAMRAMRPSETSTLVRGTTRSPSKTRTF